MSAFFCPFVSKDMNEYALLAKTLASLALTGGVPAVAFGLWSETAPRTIFRFLALFVALIYAGPALTFAYFWLSGWPANTRGPLSDDGDGTVLGYNLTLVCLLVAVTLPLGATLAIRRRQLHTLLPYIGLFFLQVGWAALDAAFFVALTD